MKKKYFKVQPMMTKFYCESCGGEMEATGEVLTSMPPQFKYQCLECAEYDITSDGATIWYQTIEEYTNKEE